MITDLKQFISAATKQQAFEIKTEIKADIAQTIANLESKLERKIDDLSASVAEALETVNEANEKRLNNHERRITKLERLTAK